MLTNAPPLVLSDDELSTICDGVRAPAAQIRHLERLGLLVKRKPNGRPLVARSEFERVLGASRFGAAQNAPAGPNVVALHERLATRKSHAPKAQGR